jgi:hypothetical protein
MAEHHKQLDEKPSFVSVLILLAAAAVLILIAQLNGKGDIGSELPYDIATTFILLAAVDFGIRRWFALMNREERRLRVFEGLAFAEQEKLGRNLTFEEVTALFKAASKNKN